MNRAPRVRAPAIGLALVLTLALALGATACGDDDDVEPSSVPEITVPEGEVTGGGETTTTAPEPDSGGVTVDPSKPDSPANDVPPAPDTPEAKFEEFCEKNPAACG
jgi:hypothetical protein